VNLDVLHTQHSSSESELSAKRTLGSSLPSGAITFIVEKWSVKIEEQLILPISAFFIGYVVAPLLFGQLSESCGRRPIML
jgi:MFS family permease